MLELLNDLPAGTVGFRCHGRLSGDDVERVAAPAIRDAIAEYDRIKALLVFEPDFEGFTFAAAWDDTGLGLRYWDGFERLAVVTDHGWMRHGLRATGPVAALSAADLRPGGSRHGPPLVERGPRHDPCRPAG